MARWFPILLILCLPAWAEQIEFSADYYTRDMAHDTVKGKGNAWVRRGDRQIWADDFEANLKTNTVVATGNVHIKDGAIDIWCNHTQYDMNGDTGEMKEAALANGQMVITGSVIRKLSARTFEVENGTYSNCNTSLHSAPDVGKCRYDWRLYGRHFRITTESYAQFTDAIMYVRDMPVLYTPYFLLPVKTERQTGFLLPSFATVANLGSGFTVPFFWALGPWHDLTLNPTFYSKTGYHGALDYRYAYSKDSFGKLSLFFTQRRFTDNILNPAPDDPSRKRLLGVAGEWSIQAENRFRFGSRGRSRNRISLVSNPYYSQDYSRDLGVAEHASYLRSQIAGWWTEDHWLASAMIRHHQSLVLSKDTGPDRGAVVQFPHVGFSRTTSSLAGPYLSWELDASANNFVRFPRFDQIPSTPSGAGVDSDPDRTFDGNDYIRAGQRVRLEPRLVGQLPMPPGFQLQPVLTAGGFLYHFDLPQSSVVDRQYVQTEVPFTLYLSRRFDLDALGLGKVAHVFQPRVIYARSLYDRVSDPGHPFFFESPVLSNPRFDLKDQFSEFEYMRFELINRFLRPSGSGASRFFLLQVAQQYNLRTFTGDPRYKRRLGPLEIYSELALWRLQLQLQATYDLETTTPPGGGTEVHENNWSANVRYEEGPSDFIRLNTLLRTKADRALSEQSLYLEVMKSLPVFFDIHAQAEYSWKRGELLGYSLGLLFQAKPRSCWGLLVVTGRNSLKQPFVNMDFRLNFGNSETL